VCIRINLYLLFKCTSLFLNMNSVTNKCHKYDVTAVNYPIQVAYIKLRVKTYIVYWKLQSITFTMQHKLNSLNCVKMYGNK